MEPYRIKSIKAIKITTKKERKRLIKDADYNVFKLKADDVMIDLLTDSGTSAMSNNQWSAMLKGDESYAGAKSFFHFADQVRFLTGFKHVYPTHQGRAAERLLFEVFCKKGDIVPNNTHFDTTRANVEHQNAEAQDLVIKEGMVPSFIHPFKGNMDCTKLENLLAEHGEKVPLVMITITNNAGGGQPVSMDNIKMVSALCKKYKKPFFIDSCRFAENAYFIQQREYGYKNKTITEIVQEMFSYADGMTMSAKKDGLVNIGGWLALNDDTVAKNVENLLIITEGFTTYGGLSGRDLEAIAVGLQEVVEQDYLKERISSVHFLGKCLQSKGIPVIEPFGGHAIFIDAAAMLPDIRSELFPGQSLAVELYIEGGIRGVEIGSVMFGQHSKMELVRLAIPRRVYTRSHLEYVAEVTGRIFEKRHTMKGYVITWQPEALRHFTAEFAEVN